MPSDCAVCGQAAEPLAANGTPPSKPIPYEVDVTALSEGLKSEVQAAEHAFALDAGRALGGQQSAPSPVQAFLSSIVACTQVGGRGGSLGGCRGARLRPDDRHSIAQHAAANLLEK